MSIHLTSMARFRYSRNNRLLSWQLASYTATKPLHLQHPLVLTSRHSVHENPNPRGLRPRCPSCPPALSESHHVFKSRGGICTKDPRLSPNTIPRILRESFHTSFEARDSSTHAPIPYNAGVETRNRQKVHAPFPNLECRSLLTALLTLATSVHEPGMNNSSNCIESQRARDANTQASARSKSLVHEPACPARVRRRSVGETQTKGMTNFSAILFHVFVFVLEKKTHFFS